MKMLKNKYKNSLPLLLSGGILIGMISACEPNTTTEQDYRNPTSITDTDQDAVEEGWVGERTVDGVKKSKDAFIAQHRELISNVDSKMNKWKSELKTREEDELQQLNERMGELEEKRKNLDLKLNELATASEDSWVGLEKGAQEAAKDLQTSLKEVETEFGN